MTADHQGKNLVVSFADKNRLAAVKQLFSSVYWNSGWQGDYMLLTPDDTTDEELAWFRKKGILIKKYKTPVYYGGLKKFPITVYIVFYLFTEEFKKWNKIIFLDTDIIVTASLDELTQVDGFAAADDALGAKLNHQFSRYWVYHSGLSVSKHVGLTKEEFDNAFNRLKWYFSLNKPAFNSGVFCFSTDIIKPNSFEKLLEIFKLYGKISAFAPQGELNLMFFGSWQKLPIIYNAYPMHWIKYYKMKKSQIKGAVLHFIFIDKPWQKGNPFYDDWKTNYDRAELIDLNSRPAAQQALDPTEREKYQLLIRRKRSVYLVKASIKSFFQAFLIWTFIKKCYNILTKQNKST